MRVFNRYDDLFMVSNGVENPMIIDTNNQGDFFFLPLREPVSKYNGLFFNNILNDDQPFKIISELKLKAEPYAVFNDNFSYKRFYNNAAVKVDKIGDLFKLPYEEFDHVQSGFIYKIRNYNGMVDLLLDMRKIYDYDDQGRFYEVKVIKERNLVLIKYKKIKSDGALDYEFYLVITGGKISSLNDSWHEKYYSYDKSRKDGPYSSWVYNALSFQIDKDADIIFTYGESEKTALEKMEFILENFHGVISHKKFQLYDFYNLEISDSLPINDPNDDPLDIRAIKENKTFFQRMIGKPSAKSNKTKAEKLAYISAKHSLFGLLTDRGIYAGLPWFFQVWTRDESISIGALIKEGKLLSFVKQRLFSYLEAMQADGRIPNREPHSDLASADGTGWVFKRIHDLIIKAGPQIDVFFSDKELKWIYDKLDYSIKNILKNYGNDLLVSNKPLETWMDTSYKDDTREGYRIEIQALTLSMINLAYILSSYLSLDSANIYLDMYNKLKEKIKKLFFFGNILTDGKGDMTIRPNVFLAYYIDSSILSRTEWESVFDNYLKNLWTEWGGLTTIQKNSDLFLDMHSGIDNRSYHRGDVWYFVNHIAGICLNDVNPKKYKKYVDSIIHATINEMFTSGSIGAVAEISSASCLSSLGCFDQAWSNATFVELLREARWKKN